MPHTATTTIATIAIVFAAFSLAACGSGGGSGGGLYTQKPDLSQCKVSPDSGPSALMGNSRKIEFVVSEYFQKPYDRYDLEAVTDASVTSTADYVKSLGINLKKVIASTATSCPNYYSVETTSDKALIAIWNEQSGGAPSGGSLQGLFFEFCGEEGLPSCREREMVSPTILLNHASNRWTIVHEMMHYNFNQGRKADPNIPSPTRLNQMLKFHNKELKAYIDEFAKVPNRGDLIKILENIEMLAQVGRFGLVQKSLEEVSIEALLIDLWAKGEFKNSGEREPSTWYMESSLGDAQAASKELGKLAQQFEEAAAQNFWPDLIERAKNLEKVAESPEKEAKAMIADAKQKIAKALQNSPLSYPYIMGLKGSGNEGGNDPTAYQKINTQKQQAHQRHLESLDHEKLVETYITNLKELNHQLQVQKSTL